MIQLYNEDCIEGMKRLPDNSVDAIICDPPYNLTNCKWDATPIDLPAMWEQFKRILKPCCSAVLFASGKFTYKLVASNLEQFKYKWFWIKNAPTMFIHAKNAPMRKVEEICVFSDGAINHASCTTRRMKYNPQGLVPCGELQCYNAHTSDVSLQGGKLKNNIAKGTPSQIGGGKLKRNSSFLADGDLKLSQLRSPIKSQWERNGRLKAFGNVVGARPSHVDYYVQEYTGYPSDVLEFKSIQTVKKVHPSQKPVPLLEFLIKTYTNEGETVLDATMGSGSTGVAAVNTNRNFIGFELDKKFFDIAKERIDKAVAEREQLLF